MRLAVLLLPLIACVPASTSTEIPLPVGATPRLVSGPGDSLWALPDAHEYGAQLKPLHRLEGQSFVAATPPIRIGYGDVLAFADADTPLVLEMATDGGPVRLHRGSAAAWSSEALTLPPELLGGFVVSDSGVVYACHVPSSRDSLAIFRGEAGTFVRVGPTLPAPPDQVVVTFRLAAVAAQVVVASVTGPNTTTPTAIAYYRLDGEEWLPLPTVEGTAPSLIAGLDGQIYASTDVGSRLRQLWRWEAGWTAVGPPYPGGAQVASDGSAYGLAYRPDGLLFWFAQRAEVDRWADFAALSGYDHTRDERLAPTAFYPRPTGGGLFSWIKDEEMAMRLGPPDEVF